MNLDEKFIYAFIRQDMFPDHQMVHTFHLGFMIGKAVEGYCQKRNNVTGHPSVILIGIPYVAAFEGVRQKLAELNVEYITWNDPDSKEGHDDFELPGIVTEPISKSIRNKLGSF